MMKHEKEQDKSSQDRKAKTNLSKTMPFRNLKPIEKKPTDKMKEQQVVIDLQEILK